MLFVLHIRLFPMSYDSGGMSLSDSEINYDFFWSFMTFDFWSNYSTLYVIYKCQNICIKNQVIYLLKSCILVSSKPSKDIYIYIYIYICRYIYIIHIYYMYGIYIIYIYINIYICVCVCVCVYFLFKTVRVFMRFSLQDFNIIPCGFGYLPGEKTTARSHPKIFFKIWNFPWWVKQPQPGYWDSVFILLDFWQLLLRNGKISSKCLFWNEQTACRKQMTTGKLFYKHFSQL